MDYDKEHDILYISINKPQPSYSDDELWKGVFIRKSVESNYVSGATILDFSKRNQEALKKHLPFDVDFKSI
jgi:uncharacterized protein YuzE